MGLVRPPKSADLFFDIQNAYSGSGRYYHNLNHLQHCFETLDDVMAKLPGTGSIELALWYHDFVYDPKAKDNEERSAEVALGHMLRLGFPREFGLQISSLVLATKHVSEPVTREAKVLLDVDLAILGSSWEQFDAYEVAIRKEYGWVPEERFRFARAGVLRRFLERPWIYSTPEFRDSSQEGRARENLTRSLARL